MPQNALRLLTGAPVLTYNTTVMTDEQIWEELSIANNSNWPMTIDTDGVDDNHENSCGVTQHHAFSIFSAFELKDENG